MIRKYGKVLIPLAVLMVTAISIVVVVLYTPAFARPVDDVRDRVGSYTGPISGTAQDDNIKASLDLLHNRIHDKYGGGSTDGSTFYVDSDVAGSAGTDWSTAVGTLDAAIALCGTNHGDTILVAPGHAENLSTADGVDCDVAGVTIIGLGHGNNRPTFTYTNANGEFVIGTDNVVVKNMIFIASVTAVTTAINVESGSTGYVIEGCFFDVDVDGTDEFIDCITVSTASCDDGIIRNNFFDSGTSSNSGPQSWINIVDGNDIIIENNIMYGDCAVACIENETTAAYNLTIRNNLLFNGIIGGEAGLNTQPCIELKSDTTGIITDNLCFCNVESQALAIVAADCFLSGNVYVETEGTTNENGWPNGKRNITTATTSAMGGGDYQAADDPTIFTVDGDILCRACATISTQITSTSNDTLELGVPGNTAALLVQDVADGTAFDAGDTWSLITAADADGAQMADEWLVVSDGDIVLTINDHDITAGVATFYLEWVALSPNASVVDAAP